MKNYNSDAWMARLITQTVLNDDAMSGIKRNRDERT